MDYENGKIGSAELSQLALGSSTQQINETISRISGDESENAFYDLFTAEKDCLVYLSGVVIFGNIANGWRQLFLYIDDLMITGNTDSAYGIGSMGMEIPGLLYSLKKGEKIRAKICHLAGNNLDVQVSYMYNVVS